jgi:hypothetical protein
MLVVCLIGLSIVVMLTAALGAYASVAKGRPPIEGAIFGFLLGPIGVIVASAMPEIRRPSLESADDEDGPVDVDAWDVSEQYRMPVIRP